MVNQGELEQIAAERVERRREPRANQPAAVTVRFERPGGGGRFQAVLMNVSDGGLAIRHWRKELLVGEKLSVTYPAGSEFAATVKWNWAVGPVVISGLSRQAGAAGARSTFAPDLRLA